MSALRRGACPTLSAPMPTGDGLLVRIVPASPIALNDLAVLSDAAQRCGSGIVEITSRGSIQVRGLDTTSAADFARALSATSIDTATALPILTDPLAGLAIDAHGEPRALAARLCDAVTASALTPRLGPKVTVIVDGGTGLHLDAIAADVRLITSPDIAGYRIAVGGNAATAAPVGLVTEAHAIEAALRVLEIVARHGTTARAHQIVQQHGVNTFFDALAGLVTPAPPQRPRAAARPIGRHLLRDGTLAIGFGLAFGHTAAAALAQLVTAADRAHASLIGTAPRSLLVIGVAPERASDLIAAAQQAGFVTTADDPRLHVVACAGQPLCASGHLATRALAPVIAETMAPLLNAATLIHLSGCAKGCAHAGNASLTIVGDNEGCRLVVAGSAADAPTAIVATDTLPARLHRLAHQLAATIAPGEDAACAITRLGHAGLTDVLHEVRHA